jgi:hypothetical protein
VHFPKLSYVYAERRIPLGPKIFGTNFTYECNFTEEGDSMSAFSHAVVCFILNALLNIL